MATIQKRRVSRNNRSLENIAGDFLCVEFGVEFGFKGEMLYNMGYG